MRVREAVVRPERLHRPEAPVDGGRRLARLPRRGRRGVEEGRLGAEQAADHAAAPRTTEARLQMPASSRSRTTATSATGQSKDSFSPCLRYAERAPRGGAGTRTSTMRSLDAEIAFSESTSTAGEWKTFSSSTS